MDLIFLGTPAFAVATLERALDAGHRVLTVITQPDRPKGRGQALAMSAVKEAALRRNLPVFQPERIRRPEVVEQLAQFHADAMVVVGYGQIIPQSIIDLPRYGIINVHASLLPKYRGAAPVQWAIGNGETSTGVTTMRIDAGLDTGDMLLRAETEIGPEENAIELGQRLATLGADLLVETLARIETLSPEKQDPTEATLAPILKKEDGAIDWTQPAAAIHNRVRGLLPWPGAYTKFRGQTLHIWRSRVSRPLSPTTASQSTPTSQSAPTSQSTTLTPKPHAEPRPSGSGPAPGHITRAGRALLVCCSDGALELLEIQLEGKKRITAEAFANGQRLQENEILGGLS